jgi:AraC family transcriptional regulator
MKSAVSIVTSGIKQHLPGSSRLGLSSHGLGWLGFSILEYIGDRGERPEQFHERHILALWRRNIATGERTNGRGGYVRYTRYPNRVTLIPPGIIREHYAHNPHNVLLCFLDPSFVNGVEQEMDRYISQELQFRTNINDQPTRQLIVLLASEAAQGGPSGRLYADHLAHSLAIRLLLLGSGKKQSMQRETSVLPPHLMRRVLERMHDLQANLDLQTLASETGYSRNHFLRMFYAAAGTTPHKYLLQLRVRRAQELLRCGSMPLIDIAAHCGFSNHAHMSRIFRQMLGVSPTEYRRNL